MFENLPEEERQNLSFQLVVAIRDTMSIAKKNEIKPTYESAIRCLHEINPSLYEEVIKALPFKNLSELAKYFQGKARLETAAGKPTTPIQSCQKEINELKGLIKSSNGDENDKRLIEQRIISYEAVKENLRPRRISENRYLQRDFAKIERSDFGANFLARDDFKVDFKLKANSFLRIRLLHPDSGEHITGADLIYEQHDEQLELIRFMFLQYKIWDNGVLYFSKAKNLELQLRKMKSILCDKQYCSKPINSVNKENYRFPYCSAFLRPTDRIQQSNEKMISSGIHIPICSVLDWRDKGDISIEKNHIKHSTLNHQIFETLFNKGFIGSRWLHQTEVESFYKENNILDSEESIKIYAREIIERKEF